MVNLKKLMSISLLGSVLVLTGCATTDQYGRTVTVNKEGCDRGTSYGGAALGAVAGGLLGSAIGSGSGRDVATVAGLAGGAYLGSRSGVGCDYDNNGRRVYTEERVERRYERDYDRRYDNNRDGYRR